jgi:RNA polymerase sigma-70 factor (ECF subfamily)
VDLDDAERKLFEQATLPHLNAAYNLARWLTQDDHAAEDVVQEAYYRAARYFGSFRGGDGRAWLLAVVRRASFDWLADRRGPVALGLDQDVPDREDDRSNPALQAIRRDEQEHVRTALEELPAHLREVVVLRELEGMSYQQIAAVVQIPVGTVMSRLSRGRRHLQRQLASGWGERAL